MNRRTMIFGSLAGWFGWAVRAGGQQTQGGPNPRRVADTERAFAATMTKRDAAGFASHVSQEAIFMGASDTPRVLRRKGFGLRTPGFRPEA